MTAIWTRSNGTAQVIQATRFTGGAWSAPATLSDPLKNATNAPVAVGVAGSPVVVWTEDDGGTDQASRFTGAAWSAPATLSTPGANCTQPMTAVDGGPIVRTKPHRISQWPPQV